MTTTPRPLSPRETALKLAQAFGLDTRDLVRFSVHVEPNNQQPVIHAEYHVVLPRVSGVFEQLEAYEYHLTPRRADGVQTPAPPAPAAGA